MEPILLSTPKHFVDGHVVKVGLKHNELFVAYRDKTILEIWTVHCYIPCSWKQLFKQEYHDLFYAKCTLSIEYNYIFVLVAAFFVDDFSVHSLPLLDEEQICENCTRFPVVIDGDKRTALRISTDYQVFIYNSDNESWETFNVDDVKSGLDV
uniref:F-box protein n=1 Tax=Meloidogyne hapla TaxID=6305 RepID=A0A1I8BEM2_MELHA